MPVPEVRDRRGRPERGRAGLLERDEALRAVDELLDAAVGGSGGALLLDGHAGMGKTRLHEAALDAARLRGVLVMRGAGAELEVDLPFGVAGQIIRSGLRELPAAERDALLATAPALVRGLVGMPGVELPQATGGGLALSHGVFGLVAAIAEIRPVLIAVDDLHWVDLPSLEFLQYVLHRIGELPGSLLMALRSGSPRLQASIDGILAHPRVRHLTLAPLGRRSVGQLLERALPARVNQELLDICTELTAGNPFYLRELLLALVEDGGESPAVLAQRARSLAPDAVTRSLRVRVGRLGENAARLARAVAVLGDDVDLRHAAALAGLPMETAAAAADALAAVEVLLAREPLRFVHPLVRRAVELDIPASELAGHHLEAARLLHADGAEAGRIASHLLAGRPEGNPWAVEQLRLAAREAITNAAPASAVSYLLRALAEPPGPEQRARVLAELGAAEASAGVPAAAEHLAKAAEASGDPRHRAALALQRGHALRQQGHQEQAAAAYQEGLRELRLAGRVEHEQELYDELQSGFLGAGSMVTELQALTLDQAPAIIARMDGEPQTHGQRLLLAHAALNASFAGRPAAEVVEMAERAWSAGELLQRESAEGMGWSRVSQALALSGELEKAVDVVDAARADAQRRASPLAFATASYMRAIPQLWQSNLTEAIADLEQARNARRFGWRHFVRGAAAQYSLCLIERGELDRAEHVLDEEPLVRPDDLEDAIRFCALAELRLAQGRAEEALTLSLDAGRQIEKHAVTLGYCPWRITAAQAALQLGRSEQALELAETALATARRTGVAFSEIRALRVKGIALGGNQALQLLRHAVTLGETLPPRLETLRAQVELGAALRRSNRRVEAREALVPAADLAQQHGLVALHERARTEMAASGARPRRDMILTGREALTPSERRIAQLAAQGQSNREIAQALFVTPKTVEYHLRNAYRKLAISSRQDLLDALAE